MTLPLLTNIERLCKAKLNPLIVPGFDGFNLTSYPKTFTGSAYWVGCGILLKVILDNIVQPFNFGSFARSHTSLMSFNYFGHCVATVTYIILELMPGPKKDKKKDA